MITLSELQLKEIIVLQTGRRLGFIADFEIDESSGSITAFVVATKQSKGNLFNRMSETIISWDHIVTIGDDIILIDERTEVRLFEEEREGSLNEDEKDKNEGN